MRTQTHGSGTTGRVAIELNRRCMLLDLAYTPDAYAPLALERMREVQRDIFAYRFHGVAVSREDG